MQYDLIRVLPHKLALWRIPKLTLLLVLLGLVAFGGCLSWWLQNNRLSSPWLFVAFLIFCIYGSIHLIGSWILYVAANYANRHKL